MACSGTKQANETEKNIVMESHEYKTHGYHIRTKY